MKGIIFNVQKFTLQDGPGLRTTVFMKGCPLECKWCSNPESWQTHPEIMINNIRCISECHICLEKCPSDAISLIKNGKGINIDSDSCDLCMDCVSVCPTRAIEAMGESLTVDEVLRRVLADRVFYKNSGGGMTVSGGEPLLQGDFVADLCRRAKENGIHTTLDTSGHAPWKIFEKVLKHVDLLLYDIKQMNTAKHREGTGAGNELILSNARKAASLVRMWFRVPLIPGYNDSEENMEELARFACELNIEKISILPYHEWGLAKYLKLGRVYEMEGTETPSDNKVAQIVQRLEDAGLTVTVNS